MYYFRNLSFRRIVGILVIVSISILLINSFIIYYITEVQEKQNKVINIAGRQRMLTQKLSKELLLFLYEDESFSLEITNTVKEFDGNLKDLQDGNDLRGLPPTWNKEIIQQQELVADIWEEFRENVQICIDDSISLSEKEKSAEYIKKNNIELLEQVNKTVILYEKNSIQNQLIIIQTLIFLMGFTILVIMWIIVNRLINKSEIDQLTNIYNRRRFIQELKREIYRFKRYQVDFSLIMFDIDHFKKVNDQFGHDVGDQVLIKITDLVKELIRDIDIFVRWGGEEFMILVPGNDCSSTKRLAERLKREISEFKFDKVGKVTCSFGVTIFKEDDNFHTLVKRVDAALYTAKKEGRNRVISK